VHFEVRLRDELDAGRLATAVRDAALRHPLARARLAEWRRSDRAYHWEIDDELADVPLTVGGERGRFLSSMPSLEAAPPFALLLAGVPASMSTPAASAGTAIQARLARCEWSMFPPWGVVLGRCRRRATQGGVARRTAHSLDEGLVTPWRELGASLP
jgi:hypothetical protein